jgi:aldose 1-epimerase
VGNRIAQAKFELLGKKYALAANNAPHHLHGGKQGWDKLVWAAKAQDTEAGPSVLFSLTSEDGDEGYPGTVHAVAKYTLTQTNELRVEMEAAAEQPTPVNMVHHSYWNLGGHDSGSILGHELTVFSDQYTPGSPVPDGEVIDVKGTPYDFTVSKPIGKDIEAIDAKPQGYDGNWLVRGNPDDLRPVVKLEDPKSGRIMEIEANQPGVQIYTGNYLDGSIKGKGSSYEFHGALCIESQKVPNAINVPKWRDSVILKPGGTYRHVMVHRFSVSPEGDATAQKPDAK